MRSKKKIEIAVIAIISIAEGTILLSKIRLNRNIAAETINPNNPASATPA
jgi:hypothetical protein